MACRLIAGVAAFLSTVQGAQITVRVIGDNGVPFEGADVRISGANQDSPLALFTGTDGRVQVELKSGTYHVSGNFLGVRNESLVRVKNNEEVDIKLGQRACRYGDRTCLFMMNSDLETEGPPPVRNRIETCPPGPCITLDGPRPTPSPTPSESSLPAACGNAPEYGIGIPVFGNERKVRYGISFRARRYDLPMPTAVALYLWALNESDSPQWLDLGEVLRSISIGEEGRARRLPRRALRQAGMRVRKRIAAKSCLPVGKYFLDRDVSLGRGTYLLHIEGSAALFVRVY